MASRLITFLGNTDYRETTYWLGEERIKTCYVAHALAQIVKAETMLVFATKEAWAKHGESLSQALRNSNLSEPKPITIGLGQTRDELWGQFERLLDVLSCDESVVFDITHGFRAQPFFASAVIQFFQSIHLDCPNLNVYYGAFESRDQDNVTPIWDLTAFVELIRWSRALLLFLRTGRADDIAEPTERLGRELRKQWALGGRKGDEPSLAPLAKAIQDFGNDFSTLRVGRLISDRPSSSERLLLAIERAKSDLTKYLPPLARVLQQVIDLVKPLATSARLSEVDGQRSLQSLAKCYHSMGRYAEAAATLREGWITRYACSQADRPGTEGFSDAHRKAAEATWHEREENLARSLADLRNDIEHAGFRSQPRPGIAVKEQLQVMIDQWCALDAPVTKQGVIKSETEGGVISVVYYSIGVDHPITPEEPLPALPVIPRGALVVIEGRAPVWRYGMAFHRLHGSAAGAVAVFDPRLGAVIVASHHPNWREGQVIDVELPPSAPS